MQTALNAIVSFSALLITIYIAWAGIGFIANPTNPEARNKGVARITNAVIGLLIVLCAWLLVDTIMKVVYNASASGTDVASLGPWNSILSDTNTADQCLKIVTPGTLPNLVGAANPTGGTPSSSSGAGTCSVQNSGACASSNFQAAFGAEAPQASEICNAESHGNASILSGTDKLGDGTPYSVGIFQINLTANSVAGLNCPSAFSKQGCTVSSCGPGTGVTVTNASLYNQCVQAAEVPANNAAAAAQIYQKGNKTGGSNSWDPWGTAAGCGLRN